MTDPFVAGLIAIDAVFAGEVIYTGAGLAGETILAIRSVIPGDDFQGYNGKGSRTTFEVDRGLLPQRPSKSDTILDGGTLWRVIDVNERRDIGRWQLTVEE